jgi:hypothetical protein
MVVRDRDDFLALLVFVAAVAKPIPTILQDVRAIYKTRNHLTRCYRQDSLSGFLAGLLAMGIDLSP